MDRIDGGAMHGSGYPRMLQHWGVLRHLSIRSFGDQ